MSSEEKKDTAEGIPDLDADALAAAAAAIAKGERALEDLPAEVLPNRIPAARPRRRERILRWVLALNLVLMGVMVVLPDPEQGERNPPEGGAGSAEAPPPPPAVGGTDPLPGPPKDTGGQPGDRWDRALTLFGEKRYGEAADVLLEYERRHPRMPEGKRLELYTLLHGFLVKAGRIGLAEQYGEKLRMLGRRGYLPVDLLNDARDAHEGGRYAESRRYDARLLLQQEQLSSRLRQSVPEVYLRIGDSYQKEGR